jgi:hypothetical protein
MHARIAAPIDSVRTRPDAVSGSYGEQFGGRGHAVYFVLAISLLWGLRATSRCFVGITPPHRHTVITSLPWRFENTECDGIMAIKSLRGARSSGRLRGGWRDTKDTLADT